MKAKKLNEEYEKEKRKEKLERKRKKLKDKAKGKSKTELEEEQEKLELKTGLGKDYGLVFRASELGTQPVYRTLDGKTSEKIILHADKVFFDKDSNELYFTSGNSLFQFPNQLIHDYRERTCGIGKFKQELLVILIDVGRIVDSSGNIKFERLNEPIELIEYRGNLYHTELDGKGLVKTPDESIAKTGNWTSGLDVLDKLYFGGQNKKLYSYDGSVREICDIGFPIWTICAVQEQNNKVLYLGGSNKKGIEILVLNDNDIKERKTILENEVSSVASINYAPLSFLERISEVR